MPKPIVHIATDEKFINAAYSIYERAFPKQNKVVVLQASLNDKLKHIKADENYRFFEQTDLNAILKETENAKIVVFHGLSYAQSRVAIALKNKFLVWIIFGAEVYQNTKIFKKEIYGKKTYNKYVYSLKKDFKDRFRGQYYKYIKKALHPADIGIQAMEKMDVVGIIYKEELELYKTKLHLKSNVQHLKFSYYPLDTVIEDSNALVNADNILIGNSASFTNNHLETFELLQNLNLGKRKLIAPLSYGNVEYGREIAKQGKALFHKNFEPLTKFMPLNEYQQILQGCGIVIMNHYRQQAVGNVLNAMYLGAKVYLSKKNTLLQYLKRIGCIVYTIEDDLVPKNDSVFHLLTKEQQQKNRNILKGELSSNRICKELQDTLKPILK